MSNSIFHIRPLDSGCMTYEELRAWCHGEMRAAIDTPIHKRAVAILKLIDVATMPPWLADAAEALGEVRASDGAPLALNWTQVIAAIGDMREERDEWKKRAESAEYALDDGELPMPGEAVLGGRRPSERQREFDSLVAERDKYHTQSQDLEKKLAAIATLVSIYDNQDEPEGQVSARRALAAIGETIGQLCSVCRGRHGSEVRHACE